jgi:hypothetical protein
MRLLKALCIAAVSLIGAVVVVLAGLTTFAGLRETRQQLHRTLSISESYVFLHARWVLKPLVPSATSAEVDVWRSILHSLTYSPRGVIPVAVDSSSRWPVLESQAAPYLLERIAEGSPNDPGDWSYAAAVHDFIFRNSRPAAVSGNALLANVRMIPLATLDAEDQGPNGWLTFTGRNNVRGFVTVSRVGFTPRGDRAVVFVQLMCGPLCGHGAYYVLQKRNGHWEVMNQHVSWVS